MQLAATGRHTHQDIAALVGRARSTIQEWIDRYEAGGLDELLARKKAPGQKSPLQNPALQARLQAELKKGTLARGGPTGRVAAQQTHGIQRAAKSLYYWLGKAGGVLQVPRPAHVKQDPAARAGFRAHRLEKLQALPVPAGQPVKVWMADECRGSLHPFTRRCWGLRGPRVVVPRQHRYEWEYVYGAVEVVAGQSQFRLMPSVNLDFSGGFLEQIAASDPSAAHIVIWDQAGFHPRPEGALPARIHLLPLPPYSPELNPVEGLWDQLKDALGNRLFATLEALEAAVTEALRPFWESRDKVLSLVFGWVRDQANAT